MKKIIHLSILFLLMALTEIEAQILSTANQPSQVYPGSGLAEGPGVFGVFVGRTPCQELLKEWDLGENKDCTKRKMAVTLYQDPVTLKPTTYETRGMGKWSGKGNWRMSRGTPTDANAIVFEIILSPTNSLFLLQGDDNVLFILDKNKNFLIGNANYSYTLSRGRN